jgi:hypothetical protein
MNCGPTSSLLLVRRERAAVRVLILIPSPLYSGERVRVRGKRGSSAGVTSQQDSDVFPLTPALSREGRGRKRFDALGPQ